MTLYESRMLASAAAVEESSTAASSDDRLDPCRAHDCGPARHGSNIASGCGAPTSSSSTGSGGGVDRWPRRGLRGSEGGVGGVGGGSRTASQRGGACMR